MVIDSVVEKGDEAFDEDVFMLQHQIAARKERTNNKLQKLEATIGIAREVMVEILQMKVQELEEGFINPFVSHNGWKDNASKSSDSQGKGKLQQLKLRVLSFEEAGVIESLQDCEQLLAEETIFHDETIYDEEPVYDEEPGDGQEFWPEHEFILTALRGENSDLSKPLQSEICTSETAEELAEFLSIQEFQQGKDNNNLKNEITPIQLEEVISLIPTSTETVEAFLDREVVKDFSAAEIFYNLGMKSSNFDKRNMLMFDPGDQVQDKHLKGHNHKSKELIRSEVKLEETGMKTSVGSELRHWQDIDVLAIEKLLKKPVQLQGEVSFIIEIEVSTRLQGQGQNIPRQSDRFDKIVSEINQQFVDYDANGIGLPYEYHYMVLAYGRFEMNKSMRTDYLEALRKTVTICIFDPGGDLSCLNGVLVADSVGFLKVHHLFLDILLESLSKMQAMTVDRLREVKKCKIHHEDMLVFKGEGLSGLVLYYYL